MTVYYCTYCGTERDFEKRPKGGCGKCGSPLVTNKPVTALKPGEPMKIWKIEDGELKQLADLVKAKEGF